MWNFLAADRASNQGTLRTSYSKSPRGFRLMDLTAMIGVNGFLMRCASRILALSVSIIVTGKHFVTGKHRDWETVSPVTKCFPVTIR